MHTHTAHEPEYHNMAAGDDDAIPAAMDAENTPFQHMFDPPIDIRNEEVHEAAEREPRRSKTKDNTKRDRSFRESKHQ